MEDRRRRIEELEIRVSRLPKLLVDKNDPQVQYLEWREWLDNLSIEEHEALIKKTEETDPTTCLAPKLPVEYRSYAKLFHEADILNLKTFLHDKKFRQKLNNKRVNGCDI